MSVESWVNLMPALLASAGIESEVEEVTSLTGGISSDIVLVRTASGRRLCAKRALPQLKVEQNWEAPVERSSNEAAWLRIANCIRPGSAPAVLGEDLSSHTILMEYLAPDDYTLWKSDLLGGTVDANIGHAVGDTIGSIHEATWGDEEVAHRFATGHIFRAIRLDPYLRATADIHENIAPHLLEVLRTTESSEFALVHGDVSPKNILISRQDHQPVLIDAECAWYGDPAFDAAFCLNHFLLKAIYMDRYCDRLLDVAQAFTTAWLAHFEGSQATDLEQRTARLLPCLLLARIDGKSPIEYLDQQQRDVARLVALELIRRDVENVFALFAAFKHFIHDRKASESNG